MERRKFTREFKLEAVRLIKDRGVSYVQASQDLSVHPSQLRDFIQAATPSANRKAPQSSILRQCIGISQTPQLRMHSAIASVANA
jgi:transposase-like protein